MSRFEVDSKSVDCSDDDNSDAYDDGYASNPESGLRSIEKTKTIHFPIHQVPSLPSRIPSCFPVW